MLRIALMFVQFFSALAIVGLVMLQRGKGAEAGAGFGAGASGTVFGARGAGTALSRATAIFTAVFMLNSLALTYVGSHHPVQQKTIFDTAAETQQPAAGSAAPGASSSSAQPGAPAASGAAAGTRSAGGASPRQTAPSSRHAAPASGAGTGAIPAPAPATPPAGK